ncbi:hypothetical protein C8R47DRAFT_638860 [Mycena vitilis]|nr:hypothetical protein C8R47DRAFT_638860 [Mycena vitilis]
MVPPAIARTSGGTQTHPTASERAALGADRARIADIDLEILELEASVNALKKEKTTVQRRLDAYTYPVLTLPNEITSEIFVHFLPVYPKAPPPIGPLSPHLLCQICQKWRDIALATPALWRAISLPLREEKGLGHKLRLLEKSLERSGSCPVSIELQSLALTVSSNLLPQFGRTVAEYCARWEHLTLPSRTLAAIPYGLLPRLRSLKLGPDRLREDISIPTFLAAPLLQKVSIYTYRATHLSIFPWSQLTVLSVYWVTLDYCADILSELVNIIYCQLRINSTVGFNPSRSVTLTHLKTFILIQQIPNLPSQLPRHSVFDTLTLPALRRLHSSESLVSAATLQSLVTRSGCDLEELCIPNAAAASHFLYRTALPSVTTFAFDFGHTRAVSEHFFDASDNAGVSEDEYPDSGSDEESGEEEWNVDTEGEEEEEELDSETESEDSH